MNTHIQVSHAAHPLFLCKQHSWQKPAQRADGNLLLLIILTEEYMLEKVRNGLTFVHIHISGLVVSDRRSLQSLRFHAEKLIFDISFWYAFISVSICYMYLRMRDYL